MQEHNKYIRGLISWIGFKQTPFYYQREVWCGGATNIHFGKWFASPLPEYLTFQRDLSKWRRHSASFRFLAGLLLSVWLLYNKLVNPQFLVTGWTSIILVVVYFGGVQLLTIGILGQDIGSLFDEVKKRPEYIVDEALGLTSLPQTPYPSDLRLVSTLRKALTTFPATHRGMAGEILGPRS